MPKFKDDADAFKAFLKTAKYPIGSDWATWLGGAQVGWHAGIEYTRSSESMALLKACELALDERILTLRAAFGFSASKAAYDADYIVQACRAAIARARGTP